MKNKVLNQGIIGLAAVMMLSMPIMAHDYENHWAQPAIDTWSTHGVIKGYEDGTFKPSGKITRGELAAMLDRTLGLPIAPEGTRKFTDVPKDKWYAEAIGSVTANGLMYSAGTEFRPDQNATREEVAYAMAQAYQLEATSVAPSFKDDQKVSTWAKSSVEALVSGGLIKGYEDGTFKPQESITRAEFVTILDNITDHYITAAGTYTEDLEGNVMIAAPDVVLKGMTIKGNLYLAPGLETSDIMLEDVKVEGAIYIQGGSASLKGDYNTVVIATKSPAKLLAGTIKNLHMKQSGAKIDLAKDTVVEHLTVYKPCEVTGQGAIKQKTSMIADKAYIESAGVHIGGKYVPIDMVGDTIVIDIQKLIKEHGIAAKMDSLAMFTSENDVYVKGYRGGKFLTNTTYTFRQANKEIGILQEMIDQIGASSSAVRNIVQTMGVTGESAFDLLGMGSSIELGMLQDQYYTIANLVASYGGVGVPTAFEFKYDLYQGDEKVNQVKIKLIIQ